MDWDGDEIRFESFQLLERLGKGSFGEVFKAALKKTLTMENHKIYALKAMKKSKIIGNNQLKYVISEWNIMKTLSNPFVVSLYYAFQTPKYLYLAIEYCGGRDLAWHLDKKGHFEERIAKLWIAEVLLAIEYLHSKNIVYRDLKPSNVMVALDGHIKLTDFGLAKEGVVGMEFVNTFWGSPAYLAPELIKSKKFNKASDIYQIGVLFFELLTGRPPFYKSSRESLFEWIKNSYNLEVPPHVSQTAIDLLGRLLNKIPSKRIGVNSLDEVKNHDFFNDVDWEQLVQRNPSDGIFTEAELQQAHDLVNESMNAEDEVMREIQAKIDFVDEDYKDEDEYFPLTNSYKSKLFWQLN